MLNVSKIDFSKVSFPPNSILYEHMFFSQTSFNFSHMKRKFLGPMPHFVGPDCRYAITHLNYFGHPARAASSLSRHATSYSTFIYIVIWSHASLRCCRAAERDDRKIQTWWKNGEGARRFEVMRFGALYPRSV